MARVLYFLILGGVIIYYSYKNRKIKREYRDKKHKEFELKHKGKIKNYMQMLGGQSNDNDNNKHSIFHS
ncbi:MAG: hypothetical protein ACOCRK_06825 [bacterium]